MIWTLAPMARRETPPHKVSLFPRLFILVAATLACAVVSAEKLKLNKLPNQLDKKGLVIMQIGPSQWDGAEIKLSNGKKSKIQAGFLVESLTPGQYSVESVTGLSGFNYGVISHTTTYSTLTIGRDFEVLPGSITNLGLLYVLEQSDHKNTEDKEVFALSFDNKGAVSQYLQQYYPTLSANISADDIILAPHTYSNDKLPEIRNILYRLYAESAYRLYKAGNEFLGMLIASPVQLTESGYAVGDLGLIAQPNDDGKLNILANDSVARLSQVKYSEAAPWFFSQSGDLYRMDGARLVPVQSKPDDFHVASAAMLSDTAIALADRRFNFLVSMDVGQTWQQSDHLSLPDNQSLSIDFAAGADRIYAMGRDSAWLMKKPAAAILDRSTGEVSDFELPKKIKKHMKAIFETEAGLYVQTEKAGSTPTTLHLLRTGSDKWEKSEVMRYFGCRVAFPNQSGRDITALCGPRKDVLVYSRDYGQTWERGQAQVSAID